jgi:hypothetical protein
MPGPGRPATSSRHSIAVPDGHRGSAAVDAAESLPCSTTRSPIPLRSLPLAKRTARARAESDQDHVIDIPRFRVWKTAKSSKQQDGAGGSLTFPASAAVQRHAVPPPNRACRFMVRSGQGRHPTMATPGSALHLDSNVILHFVAGSDKIAFSDPGFHLGLANPSVTPPALPADLFAGNATGCFANTAEAWRQARQLAPRQHGPRIFAGEASEGAG